MMKIRNENLSEDCEASVNRLRARTQWGSRDNRRGLLDAKRQNVTECLLKNTKQLQGINFAKYSNIPVSISENMPVLESFESFEVEDILKENLARLGFNLPTPVQKYGIPPVLLRKDIIACAQTGSGKTVAYLFPLIAKMLQDGPPPSEDTFKHRPVSLILAPTRELAMQIYDESLKLLYNTGIISCCVYGGVPIGSQVNFFRHGVDMLIGTPGRIIGLIECGLVNISIIRYLVLDEADKMLDMGFEPQLIHILKFIEKKERETIMYSATFPQEIKSIAEKYLNHYVQLTIGRVGSTSENIEQQLISVSRMDKAQKLLEILRSVSGRVLSNFYVVFVERKDSVDVLQSLLLRESINCCGMHGGKMQLERNKCLEDFKSGSIQVLIATDVAARGLDIPEIQYVIIYELPGNIDQYVHRIGRTGRIGNKGVAIVFIDNPCAPVIKDLKKLLAENNKEVPNWLGEDCQILEDDKSFGLNTRTTYRFKSKENYCQFSQKFNNETAGFKKWNNDKLANVLQEKDREKVVLDYRENDARGYAEEKTEWNVKHADNVNEWDQEIGGKTGNCDLESDDPWA